MKFYVVDAFTDRPFAGNPAAVCILETPRAEAWMKLVAREMNLSETAFLHPIEGGWSLRWFTPTIEVKLCGHATLASAFTLWETGCLPAGETAHFFTLSGLLKCRRERSWIEMDFPSRPVTACEPPAGLAEALGCRIVFTGRNEMDYLVEVPDEATLRSLRPNLHALATLPVRGVIVSCRSAAKDFDFVSRFFAPAAGVGEDPVTGSAHCALGPHWQVKLGRSDFTAYQASERGGVIMLSVRGERVLLRGKAVMMSKVDMWH